MRQRTGYRSPNQRPSAAGPRATHTTGGGEVRKVEVQHAGRAPRGEDRPRRRDLAAVAVVEGRGRSGGAEASPGRARRRAPGRGSPPRTQPPRASAPARRVLYARRTGRGGRRPGRVGDHVVHQDRNRPSVGGWSRPCGMWRERRGCGERHAGRAERHEQTAGHLLRSHGARLPDRQPPAVQTERGVRRLDSLPPLSPPEATRIALSVNRPLTTPDVEVRAR